MKTAVIVIGLVALVGVSHAAAQSGSAFTATPPGAVMPSMSPRPTMGATAQPAPNNPANATGHAAMPSMPQIIAVPRHHHRRAHRR